MWAQAMEVGVCLNLLCSRLDELKPGLSGFLGSLGGALLPSGQALAEFCSAFTPALETARVAHGARIEAAQAQVPTSQTPQTTPSSS